MALNIDLNGRRAIVTGVSTGIGAVIAKELAWAGCDVAGCARGAANSAGAKAFVAAVRGARRRAFYSSADVSDADAIRKFVTKSAKALGGIDIVVSNAGRNVFEGAEKCSEEKWRECMELDLAASWRLAREAKPHLDRATDPVIIIINSNHAHHTIPGCFPYNIAKAGLLAMVQSLAIEWGPGIRTVGIAPGFIDTPGGDAWFNSFPDPAAERRRTELLHPVGRIGTPREIGGICVFLASEYAKFISGTTMLVDGGRSAFMQDPLHG